MHIVWDGAGLKLKTHMVLGAGVAAAISSLMTADMEIRGLMTVLGALCASLPDFDMIPARLHGRIHRNRFSHSLGASFLIALSATVTLAVAHLTNLAMPGWRIDIMFAVAFASAFSHAASDSLTRSGVLLLWPISRRRFSGSVKYDSVLMNTLLVILGMLLIACSLLIL